MRIFEMARLVEAITYKPGWRIRLMSEDGGRVYIQVCVDETAEASTDPRSGHRLPWRGGKRFLSGHMCRQEVVGAVFGAIEAAEMHEMREWFRFFGASIYNPHIDPLALASMLKQEGKAAFNVRDDAMLMSEAGAN